MLRACPVLNVRSVEAAADHYGQLGFDVTVNDLGPEEARARRDTVELRLSRADNVSPWENQVVVYLYVNDALALYDEWQGVNGRLREPEPTPDGFIEGIHIDPDGNLIRFLSPIPETE